MLGYYVHHHGHGHLHRARTLTRALAQPVTVLSSLTEPPDWSGGCVSLPVVPGEARTGQSAGGFMHRAPLNDEHLRRRMARISQWLEAAAPTAMVVDVSSEVAVLCRLHGVPVISVVQPGDRGDRAHRTSHGMSDALVACWPAGMPTMAHGMSPTDQHRLQHVGAVTDAVPAQEPSAVTPRSVVVMAGSGGGGVTPAELEQLRGRAPDWTWQSIGGASGPWVEDPQPLLRGAAVVVTHAGEGALAAVSAARRPAVIVPEERPFAEQQRTAEALSRSSLPVTCVENFEPERLVAAVQQVSGLDGQGWAVWNDGAAPQRFAAVVDAVVSGRGLDRTSAG